MKCKSIYPIQPHSDVPPEISRCKRKKCKLVLERNKTKEEAVREASLKGIGEVEKRILALIPSWRSTEGSRVYDGSHGNTDEQEQEIKKAISAAKEKFKEKPIKFTKGEMKYILEQ
jgi:hypothetical protein